MPSTCSRRKSIDWSSAQCSRGDAGKKSSHPPCLQCRLAECRSPRTCLRTEFAEACQTTRESDASSSNPQRPPTEAIEKQQCFLCALLELLDPMLCTRHGMGDRIAGPTPRVERRELTGHSAHHKSEACQ